MMIEHKVLAKADPFDIYTNLFGAKHVIDWDILQLAAVDHSLGVKGVLESPYSLNHTYGKSTDTNARGLLCTVTLLSLQTHLTELVTKHNITTVFNQTQNLTEVLHLINFQIQWYLTYSRYILRIT